MSHRLAPALLVLCVMLAPLRAEEHKIKVVVAAPDSDLTTYYFGLLTKGPHAGTGTQEEREKTQAAHLANIRRLAREGKLLVSGPFSDNGEWRGLFIYKCASLAEAQALAASDPEVQAGRLRIEIHPWMTAKGFIRDPEFPTPR
ncbi:MAG: YciI family protein [Opitutales bacterium]